ncbi:hypothetical protein BJV78DRAFT_1285900 [Lactifluus subvellereus]|nr:hypothetical protein BJV78DRAFT_1285900 [Lactifluus subvellereus]
MTVTSTSKLGVKSKGRAKPAPKSDKQHAKEKEDNLARKMKLNAAINVAINQIDEIIEALADEYNIGFTQACSYVHLGGHIFKDCRHPTIQNVYRFCWAQVEDGRWTESDGEQIAEAVHIIKDSEKNKDKYKSLSRNDQAKLIALLQGNRDQRETGIVGKSQLRLHDICTTMEKVEIELGNLHMCSGFKYIVFGCRNQVNHYTSPTVLLSEVGCDFISHYLKFEPPKLTKHFDVFATNHAGMNGVIRRVASDKHGGDKKTATKSIIMGMFKKMYSELAKRDAFRLDWTAWSKGRPDRRNVQVIIRGWPLATPPTTLSNIHTASEMNKLLTAVVDNTCYFEMATRKERDQTTTELDTPLYKCRGMLINLDSNDSVAETLGRKRKGVFNSQDNGNKENVSPDEASPHKRPCRPSILADQSEGIPTDTLSLPPHHSLPPPPCGGVPTATLSLSPHHSLPPPCSGIPTDTLPLPPRHSLTPPPRGASLMD